MTMSLHVTQVVVTFAAGFPSSGENDSPSIEAVGFSLSLPIAVSEWGGGSVGRTHTEAETTVSASMG